MLPDRAALKTKTYRPESEAVAPDLRVQLDRPELLRLFRAATHELNTPLAVIQGYLQTLRRHVNGEAGEVCLDTIQREVTRLIALSEDLYLRVRLANGDVALQATAVDLDRCLREAAVTLEEQHPGRIIGLMVERPLPAVKVDKGLLDTVLWLMLNHTLRYTNELEVTVAVRRCAEDSVELVLTDEAPCLSPDIAELIFEPLPDLPPLLGRPRLGLGLGLHVTRELVRRMGGDLRVEAQPQAAGNCFVLRLPADTDEVPDDVSCEG